MEEPTELIDEPTALTALTKIHKKPVVDCCFAPDTDQILTASEDTTVVLWNLPPRNALDNTETFSDNELICYRFSEHKAPVTAVAMHEKVFLSAARDGRVKLWKLIGSPPRRNSNQRTFKQPIPEASTYKCHQGIIRSVCFSPDARKFATASNDKSIKLWSSVSVNKSTLTLSDGHTNWIKAVRWSKTQEQLLASCGDDGRLCVWDVRSSVRQPPLSIMSTKKKTSYNCLDWHPVFTHHIATGSQDCSTTVWDLRNLKQIQIYNAHSASVNSVAFNSGGSLLLTGSSDRTSKIFDVCAGTNMFTLMSHTGPVTSVCFSPSDELFATGSQDQTVTVWRKNLNTVKIVIADECDRDSRSGSLHGLDSDAASSITIDYRSGDRYNRYHEYVGGN